MSKANGTSERRHILGLRARNIKLIREVEINDIGEVLEVRGDAANGKTSILAAIRAAIEGLDPDMIRRGADSAEIELHLSDAKINRLFRLDGSDTTIVTGKDGRNTPNAKAFLKAICDRNVFNPVAWVQKSGGDPVGRKERRREQRDQLLAALPMTVTADWIMDRVEDAGADLLGALADVDLEEIQHDAHALTVFAEYGRAVYTERTAQNRIAEEKTAALKLLPVPEIAAPNRSMGELLAEVDAANERLMRARAKTVNSEARRKRVAELRAQVEAGKGLASRADAETTLTHYKNDYDQRAKRIEQLEAQLSREREAQIDARAKWRHAEELLSEINAHEARVADLEAAEAEIDGTADKVDLPTLEAALSRAKAQADACAKQNAIDEAAAIAKSAKDKAERLTRLVQMFRDDLPKAKIAEAQLPIAGLGVDEEQILINGIPLHQLGTSEQIRIGVEIAAALNPACGFVLVDQAESLGKADLVTLRDASATKGLQLIMTFVDADAEPGPGRLVMRGGERVSA